MNTNNMKWDNSVCKREAFQRETEVEEALRKRQKSEAVTRLEMLNVPFYIRYDFKCFDRVWISSSPHGIYSALDRDLKGIIKQFEERYEATVFLVVRAFTRAGLHDSLLYVGKCEEEWKKEEESIHNGYITSCTINRDHGNCMEFNSIAFHRMNDGGIIRLN